MFSLLLFCCCIVALVSCECANDEKELPGISGQSGSSLIFDVANVHADATVVFAAKPTFDSGNEPMKVTVSGPSDVTLSVSSDGNKHSLTVATSMEVAPPQTSGNQGPGSTGGVSTTEEEDNGSASLLHRPAVAMAAGVSVASALSSSCGSGRFRGPGMTMAAVATGMTAGLLGVRAEDREACPLVVTVHVSLAYLVTAVKVEGATHLTAVPRCGYSPAPFTFPGANDDHSSAVTAAGLCEWTAVYKRHLKSTSSPDCSNGLPSEVTAVLDLVTSELSLNGGPPTVPEGRSMVAPPYHENGTYVAYTVNSKQGKLIFMETSIENNVLVPTIFESNDGTIQCAALYECISGFCTEENNAAGKIEKCTSFGNVVESQSWDIGSAEEGVYRPANSESCDREGFQQCQNTCYNQTQKNEYPLPLLKKIVSCPCSENGAVDDENAIVCDLNEPAEYYPEEGSCFDNWVKPDSVPSCDFFECKSKCTLDGGDCGQFAPLTTTYGEKTCLCTPLLPNGGVGGGPLEGAASSLSVSFVGLVCVFLFSMVFSF